MTSTTAREWLRPHEEGIKVRLPSKNYMLIRPVALDVLLTTGRIPDILSPMVTKTLWTDSPGGDLATDVDTAQNMVHLINAVIPACALSPKIVVGRVPNPDEDEIGLEHVEFPDKVFLFNLCIQPVEVLYSFRDKQERDVEPVSADDDVKPKAKRSRTNTGSVGSLSV